ncbi:hypothetical protein CcaverHIS002_0408250 [Cutaneotrichosporon cavernicola]|uniref:NADP-dependent oxidoreductase domain-containing protein n=1 Tax=Cutaneotrichosporon cavernicola TaxID=279322 RepID=A0AA48L4W1_9TREE|nr:uncharacterized protein CcaverHIS019_0408200 [Cutaneotrichosporon cavernicola]BEI84221.1 hypothetical protein CcaverHIS002_0408250 [Cutaneotrichosporon cavernicola]BEI92000.1 hypothetical protein CcaverHIS019_0408200 [Cutaneotrichosporon cavernicola]BEI99770.1 hypothetical protein CcaverHIS631_0408130 [Cutaneotrichosporon cavernicola]BEJ07546.1 hypothetical protein CcaverHIS641_0408150 [Cutaneotrichosporon cavernicola]
MGKTITFAPGLDVPTPGLGTMSLSPFVYGEVDDNESLVTLKTALDIGCTFWDSAVLYGAGQNETLLGRFFKENPGAREKITLASKCAFDIYKPDPTTRFKITNSPAHIAQFIEESKERLGSYPDIYYLHRMDPDTPLEESIPALQKLKDDGKVKYIGLSECNADTLRKACKIAHIDVLQIEYGPFDQSAEENGLMAAARELGVTVVGYSPLGRGMLAGTIRSRADLEENDFRRFLPQYTDEAIAHNVAIADRFAALGAKKGATAAQIVLAWVAEKGVIPIFGTRKAERVKDNFAANKITFTAQEKKEIDELVADNAPQGDRYPPSMMASVGR